MNAIEKLFPVSQQERSFQLKVRRDAGTLRPAGCSRNLLNVKNAAAAHPPGLDQKACMYAPIAGYICHWSLLPAQHDFGPRNL